MWGVFEFKQQPGIYKITCLVSGKVYVGSSINISKRVTVHKENLKKNKHHNPHLQYAYNKHEAENFKFEAIEYCDESELMNNEEKWINYYECNDKNKGYNIERFDRGRKRHSEESKRRISEGNKGKVRPPVSDETRRKISEAGKGRPKSEEFKLKLSISKIGKKRAPFSEEWKRKLSESHRSSKLMDVYLDKKLLYCGVTKQFIAETTDLKADFTANIKYKYKSKGYVVCEHNEDSSIYYKTRVNPKVAKKIRLIKNYEQFDFCSLKEAAAFLNISRTSGISQALTLGVRVGGYYARYL